MYELIDKIRVQGMNITEKKYRKFHTGKIPWSLKLFNAHFLIELWTVLLRILRSHKAHSNTIIRRMTQVKYYDNTNVSIREAKDRLHETYVNYRDIINNNLERIVTCLSDLIPAQAKARNMKPSTALRKLKDNEQSRESWARIYKMDGTARSSVGPTQIMAPDHNNNWVERVTQENIEQDILD